jgi:hypothetical protein
MNKALITKIESTNNIQMSLEVNFHFHLSECTVEFENPNSNDEELSDLLIEWFHEELKAKLVELDAYADSFRITFKQQNKQILALLTLKCSDDDWADNERHSKNEILNDELLTVLSTQIDNFDKQLIDFSFLYNEGFKNFNIYYEDDPLELDPKYVELIKGQIEKTILAWPGIFWGKSALKVDKFVEMDMTDYCKCYDLVYFEFEFEKSINKWGDLTSLKSNDDRIHLIYHDIQCNEFKYQELAAENPLRLFELLGGNTSEVEITHKWAPEYTYQNYIEDNDLDFEEIEAKNWKLEQKSIEQAEETGHYYCTGRISLENNKGEDLEFEFEFCEGYLEAIISTPYDLNKEEISHGIIFS